MRKKNFLFSNLLDGPQEKMLHLIHYLFSYYYTSSSKVHQLVVCSSLTAPSSSLVLMRSQRSLSRPSHLTHFAQIAQSLQHIGLQLSIITIMIPPSSSDFFCEKESGASCIVFIHKNCIHLYLQSHTTHTAVSAEGE